MARAPHREHERIARAPPGPRRATHRRDRRAAGDRHGQGLRPPVASSGQPGQRRPRAARRLRGHGLPRRRRPRAPPRRDRRRHRLRQAARPPQPEGPRRAARYVGRRPGRPGRVLRRLPGHRRLRHGDAHLRGPHLLHHRRRGVPAEAHAGQLVPSTPVETVLRSTTTRRPALLRAHRQADRVRRQGPPLRAVRGAGRRLPGPEPPAGVAGRQPCGQLEWHGGVWQFERAGSVRPRRTGAATRPASAASWR